MKLLLDIKLIVCHLIQSRSIYVDLFKNFRKILHANQRLPFMSSPNLWIKKRKSTQGWLFSCWGLRQRTKLWLQCTNSPGIFIKIQCKEPLRKCKFIERKNSENCDIHPDWSHRRLHLNENEKEKKRKRLGELQIRSLYKLKVAN